MTPTIVLIVCKTLLLGGDQNSEFTGWENREWAYEHSKMVCRRHEIQVFDTAEAQGADPQPFNQHRCIAAAVRVGTQWDIDHRSSNYRTWRVACPVPIVDTTTGQVIGWKLPECGHQDTVTCEVDSVI